MNRTTKGLLSAFFLSLVMVAISLSKSNDKKWWSIIYMNPSTVQEQDDEAFLNNSASVLLSFFSS